MKLTAANKQYIDNMSYKELLHHWAFAPATDRWLYGETGRYWSERIKELREAEAEHVTVAKALGRDK